VDQEDSEPPQCGQKPSFAVAFVHIAAAFVQPPFAAAGLSPCGPRSEIYVILCMRVCVCVVCVCVCV
jgi:hypothetical protein